MTNMHPLQQTSAGETAAGQPAKGWAGIAARIFLGLYILQSILPPTLAPVSTARAQAVPAANAPAGRRVLMDAAANGVPIAHIAPPTAAGVSRNQYGQFNVGANGLILNNSAGNVQTQLGGWIAANPQLGVVPARVIVNEVISGNVSSLRGTMEVAGARANVIVANPNGISCDGCGFLNTAGRATLATGTPHYGAGGSLDGLNVTGGSLAIGAGGLNAANVEQLDLIARGLIIEGEVWARNLNALAGANQVLYQTVQATPQAGEGAAPAFAVDIRDLGGMYANQVFLIATDKGLGVNSTGRIAAMQGGLLLSSAGDLTLKDSYAKGPLQLSSAGTTALSGLTQSDATAHLKAGGAFSNSGTVDAAGQAGIDAASFSNSGAINARAGDSNALTLQSAGIAHNSGSLYSAGGLNASARQWQGSGDTLQSGGNLNLQAQAITLAGTRLTSAGHANLTATAGDAAMSGAHLSAAGQLTVTATGKASNIGGVWQAGQGIAVSASALDNTTGTLLANGQLTVASAGQVNNSGGQLLGGSGVTLTASSLVNQVQARIASDQAVDLRLSGALGNQNSLISARTGLAISNGSAAINNTDGTLIANGSLTLQTGDIDNTHGTIGSGASARITASGANNDAGQISAAQNLDLHAASLSNRGGLLVAAGDTRIHTSAAIDNTGATMASTGGALTIDTQGQALTNDGGKLQALGNTSITAGATTSRAGLISGHDVTLALGALDNQAGQVVAAGKLGVTSQALNNDAGLIQSGGNARIDTQGHALANTHAGASGGILSGRTLDVLGGSVNNQAGYLASNGRLEVTATADIDNRRHGTAPNDAGQITSGASMHLQAANVINTGASITAMGDLGVQAAGKIDNASGTINANGDTTLHAGALDNSGAGLIGGQDITAAANSLDNQTGSIRAARDATLMAATLDNTGGTLSARRDLAATAPALLNAGGTIVADRRVSLDTSSGSLGGTLASAGDISLNVHGGYSNSNSLTAPGNLTVSADNITNSGVLHAGQAMTANATAPAGFIANSGEISGQTTVLNAAGAITNTGLIDGTDTTLNAHSVGNTGRIYGDRLSIKAPVVNNSGPGVIAARADLAIATQSLTNTDGALIYALNDLAIGSAVDATGQVTGSAASVVNRAATIEAGRTLAISAASIRNLNGGYTTRMVEAGRKQVREYQSDGGGPIMTDREFFAYGQSAPCNPTGTNPTSYMRNGWNPYECGTNAFIGYYKLNPATWGTRKYANPVTDTTVTAADYQQWGVAPPAPTADTASVAAAVTTVNDAIKTYNLDVENDYAMAGCCHYYETEYTRVTSETQLATTQPGKLLSGANMTLQGTTVNDASTIAAGASLVIIGPTVQNVGVPGVRETQTEDGRIRYVVAGGRGSWNTYNPAPAIENLDVPAFVYLENTNQTTGYTAAPSATIADTLAAAGKASVSAASFAPPAIIRVSLPGVAQGAANVILTTLPSLRVPSNSLFTLRPQPGASYLVETDPRFTRKQAFLGSDYMLQQLSRDPSRNLKRYGDGFLEQQQVNDQILALTGRRYLAGYSDTETEYKALMNAGIAFAGAYQFTPGVALSAEQMTLLTTDIVWLTTQTVALPDGSSQEVLLPQVYLRSTRDGDLTQSGALIAGGDIYIKTTGNIVNSGQIEGANSNVLVAGNDILNTGGTLRGKAVIASAARDLQNLGGSVLGTGEGSEGSSVSLMAGRDIVLRTTTQTSALDYANGHSTQTNIDRVATVQGGNVSLQAGRNILAEGAQVAATGNQAQGNGLLSVTAQGDIRISGMQASRHDTVNLASGNASGRIDRQSTTNAASNFASTGEQQIAAGGRLDIKGSNLAAGGSMALSGSSVDIEAAKDRSASDVSANQSDGTSSRGMQADESLSGGTVTAGRNLTIIANGKDEGQGHITATGAQINAGGQAVLAARNDIILRNETTEHSSLSESHSERSGLLGSSSSTANSSSRSTRVEGTTLGGDTVTLSSGHDIHIAGSNVVSDNGTVLAAKNNINIVAAQNTYEDNSFSEQKQSGLMGTGGVGFAIGKREQSGNGASSSSTSTASTVGAINGNVTIQAGNTCTQTGSDVLAPSSDIGIQAKTVNITEARETSQSQYEQRASQSGLTVSLSSPVVSAVQGIADTARATGNTSDARMKGLAWPRRRCKPISWRQPLRRH